MILEVGPHGENFVPTNRVCSLFPHQNSVCQQSPPASRWVGGLPLPSCCCKESELRLSKNECSVSVVSRQNRPCKTSELQPPFHEGFLNVALSA